MRDATSTPRSGIQQWFPFFVTILVYATIGAGTCHIYRMVESGTATWWPFPLFALMSWLILKANYSIYGSDER